MKPLLATDYDPAKLRFPVLASPKLDGVRCLIINGVAMSRSLKPIPNEFIQKLLGPNGQTQGLDGELIVGDATDKNVMQRTMSGVMGRAGEPDFTFVVFDYWNSTEPYYERVKIAKNRVRAINDKRVRMLEHHELHSQLELDAFEAEALLEGYEGVMIRDPSGRYKHGRSTVNEGILLKVKRFVDGEAEVIGFEEQMHNDNVATRDELGRTKRSSSQSGLQPAGVLGALVVRDVQTGVVFNIGTGFNAEQRKGYWLGRSKVLGLIAKYKSFPSGVKDAPRFPVFLGFRAPEDMSE